jgi:hypothetical protein
VANVSSQKKRTVRFDGYEDNGGAIDYRSLKRVKNICDSLPRLSEEDHLNRISFLLDNKQNLFKFHPETKQLRVEIRNNWQSLDQLVSNSLKPPKALEILQCLSLAVHISSSILQLHATPWLPEDWCSKSIHFPVNVEQPYVMVDFSALPASSPRVQDDYLNPYIVELGIILLELSERRLFQEWCNGRSLRAVDLKDRAVAALEWLKQEAKFKNVGEKYQEIVTLCLKCSFTPVQPKGQRTLSNERFRKVIHRDVVKRLEEIYCTVRDPFKPK